MSKVVFSAMRPTGKLHLGHWLGALQNWVNLQKDYSCIFAIADWHALMGEYEDSRQLKEYIVDMAIDWIACGIDPQKSILYVQSDVPEHSELMWILSTVTPVGLLERAVSYKDKVGKGIAPSAGLLTYPVLMAADILLYDADVVPVGKDQKQHVEMTRDIAIKFNHTFGETLKVPEVQIGEGTAVVPGTDGQKMSKSYSNTIPLFGDEKAISKAIMGIVTDSKGPTEAKDPDTCTVYQIHKLFLEARDQKALADEYRNGISYGDAKKKLLATTLEYFAPMRKKREELVKKGNVHEILEDGAKRAGSIAGKTMERVRKAVGLV